MFNWVLNTPVDVSMCVLNSQSKFTWPIIDNTFSFLDMFSLIYVCASFIVTSAYPARDVDKFPCHEYLDTISDWPDGFRGMLELPVVEDMQILPKEMKTGDVVLTFNKSINTLDIPEGEHTFRKVADNKEFRIFIKFKNQLKRLRKGDVFSLDISVHFQRYLKGSIGLSGIDFGKFHCPPEVEKPREYPDCNDYIHMIDNTPPDGFRAEIQIPVNYTMNGWNMEIGFTKELLTLDVPNGIRTPLVRNVKVYSIENREYNGFIKAYSIFRLEFMVHFDRNRFKKRFVKINYIRFGFFQCRNKSAIEHFH